MRSTARYVAAIAPAVLVLAMPEALAGRAQPALPAALSQREAVLEQLRSLSPELADRLQSGPVAFAAELSTLRDGKDPGAEKQQLMEEIVKLAENGLSVLIIEHDMRFVMEICRQIAVLNFGQLIAQGTPAAIRANPEVVEAYLGDDDGSDLPT